MRILVGILVLWSSYVHAQPLALATWNLEWLMTRETFAELSQNCDTRGQPPSHERRFPCTPNYPPIVSRTPGDFAALAKIADSMRADVVALQEVDGPSAGALVFRDKWTLACFISRKHPQKVGFAVRKGIPFVCNAELTELDIDGSSRAGADITLYPGTRHAVRLLAVHLKSGCFAGPLFKKGSCPKLRQQIPVLEQWMDERVKRGELFAILGDFNRRLEKDSQYSAGPDEKLPTSMFAALSDDNPAGALLSRATQYFHEVPCSSKDPYLEGAIDNILISQSLAARATSISGRRITYARVDIDNFKLSDHCPMELYLQ